MKQLTKQGRKLVARTILDKYKDRFIVGIRENGRSLRSARFLYYSKVDGKEVLCHSTTYFKQQIWENVH